MIYASSITAWKVSKYRVISGPYFPVFGLNTEISSVNLRIYFKYKKIRTRNNSVFGHFSRSVCYVEICLCYHLAVCQSRFSFWMFHNNFLINYQGLDITRKTSYWTEYSLFVIYAFAAITQFKKDNLNTFFHSYVNTLINCT